MPGEIQYDPARSIWALMTDRATYALGVTPEGFVRHLWWGGRIGSLADLPDPRVPAGRSSQEGGLAAAHEEYPVWGGLRLRETALQATRTDGTRELDARFVAATIAEQSGRPSLTVQLRDAATALVIELSYQLDGARDIITRGVRITNRGDLPVTLERALTAVLYLPRSTAPRTLTTLAGSWAAEAQIQRQPVVPGIIALDARHGLAGHASVPWCAISAREWHQATPPDVGEHGEVYFATLAWSGNWLLRCATTVDGDTSLALGLNDHDFAWTLAGGDTFDLPEVVLGFADDGFDGMRQRIQSHIRAHILPRVAVDAPLPPRPILYNSWEATYFAVDEPGQMRLAEHAAALGIELFVVDDGWFKGRSLDNAGLGDWTPDPAKFPRGLTPLIDHVHHLGMRFGLWVEPEMVNPDSDLYRAHADWVYHFPDRPRSESRNQLVLNLARDDVRDHLLRVLDDLLSRSAIDFIKWDMNRPFSEVGWPAHPELAREIWVRHARAVYSLLDALRARHPRVNFESCASGGGRADLGMLRRTDEVWASDNTRPDARLTIQEGWSFFLPARVVASWVTDAPGWMRRHEYPLAFRFHVAMLGTLGIGGNLLEWDEDEMAAARHWIARYRDLRPVIQDGRQYWLASWQHGWAAVQYLAEIDAQERIALFVFRRDNPFDFALPPVRLRGLDPAATYVVTGEGAPPTRYTGAWLMAHGIDVSLSDGPYASQLIELIRRS